MKKSTLKTLPLWLALALPIAGCQTGVSQIDASGGMRQSDAEFVNAAYTIAQLDDQAGKLAATKASDARVKDLAAKMSSEAAVLYPNLKAALQAEHQPAPTSLPQSVTAQIQQMSQLSGPAFDRAFVAAELDAHQRAIDALHREDSSTRNSTLKTQVDAELPAVQNNLDRLKFLSKDLNAKPS